MPATDARHAWDGVLRAPFGALALRVGDAGLTRIEFIPTACQAACQEIEPRSGLARAAWLALAAWLRDARTRIDLPFAPEGTPFRLGVWQALRDIAPGETRTYAQVAHTIGSCPRAVGGACRANPLPILIPCHRVVASHGMGGFNGARGGPMLDIKAWLLAHEARSGNAAG
jgi:methylated-DNA-[protein]-cysteine S-methyltransferase